VTAGRTQALTASLGTRTSLLERRARVIGAVRSFFTATGFLEVETPILCRAPLPERHIDAIPSGSLYLATSPEPYMKRLLAADFPRIFQVSKCFRNAEAGRQHNPEFSMLEWYRAHADTGALVADAQAVLVAACRAVHGTAAFSYQGRALAMDTPWEMLSVDDAFARHAGVTLDACPDQELFDTTLVELVEPRLGLDAPTVLHSYPACLSPMARPLPGRPDRADRFEIYIAGVELANGCAELVDRGALEANIEAERQARRAAGKDPYPVPADFLEALDTLPPCAGTALGIDRLVMLLCDAARIEDVIAFREGERH